MSDTVTAPIAEPQTIRELLARMVDERGIDEESPHRLGGGSSANGYSFDAVLPGLEHFVLKVERYPLGKTTMAKMLENYSSLTPVSKLVSGVNIGQPLLNTFGNTFSIHLRQSGRSLQNYLKQFNTERGLNTEPNMQDKHKIRANASADVVDLLLQLKADNGGQNPLTALCETAYQVVRLGYEPDFYLNNILLDNDRKTLGFVDQVGQPISATKLNDHMTPEDHLRQGLRFMLTDLKVESSNAPSVPRYEKAKEQLTDLFTEAMHTVLQKHQYDAPKEPSAFSFANVSSIQAISLNDPPLVLKERLRQLETLVAAPQR